MEVEAVNDTVLRAQTPGAYWAYRQDLYFYAVFSKPFTYTLYTDTVQKMTNRFLYVNAFAF